MFSIVPFQHMRDNRGDSEFINELKMAMYSGNRMMIQSRFEAG